MDPVSVYFELHGNLLQDPHKLLLCDDIMKSFMSGIIKEYDVQQKFQNYY